MTHKRASIGLLVAASFACGSPASPSRHEPLPLQAGAYFLSIGAYPSVDPLLLGTTVVCPSASTDVSFSIRITLQKDGASWVGVPENPVDGTVRVVLDPWDGAYSQSGITRGFQAYTGTVTGRMIHAVLSSVITTVTFGDGQSTMPIGGTMLGFSPQTIGTVGGAVAFSSPSWAPFTCGANQTNLSLRPVG